MYKFAGAQNGVECWCGNKYGKFGKSDKCNTKCRAEYLQMCGGEGANTVMQAFVQGMCPGRTCIGIYTRDNRDSLAQISEEKRFGFLRLFIAVLCS